MKMLHRNFKQHPPLLNHKKKSLECSHKNNLEIFKYLPFLFFLLTQRIFSLIASMSRQNCLNFKTKGLEYKPGHHQHRRLMQGDQDLVAMRLWMHPQVQIQELMVAWMQQLQIANGGGRLNKTIFFYVCKIVSHILPIVQIIRPQLLPMRLTLCCYLSSIMRDLFRTQTKQKIMNIVNNKQMRVSLLLRNRKYSNNFYES